jgi:hypothetical protein
MQPERDSPILLFFKKKLHASPSKSPDANGKLVGLSMMYYFINLIALFPSNNLLCHPFKYFP